MLGLLLCSAMAYAPGYEPLYTIKHCRLTAASAKQIGESSKNAWGQSIKNEDYVAVRPGFLPRHTIVRLPNGEVRKVNDHVPRKAQRILGTRRIIDIYYYESIDSRPKTKAVTRELCREFDQGWDDIEVLWRP